MSLIEAEVFSFSNWCVFAVTSPDENVPASIVPCTNVRSGQTDKIRQEYHMTHILACYDLLFEAIVDAKDMARLLDKSQLLVTKLHNKDNKAPNVFTEISSYFDDDFHRTVHNNRGEMATFLLNYMKQVQFIMRFIRGSRQGDWLLHLAALEEQTKYYFAHDLYKYARMVPVYLAQMFELETSDPHTWNALQDGDFAVEKSGIPFTDLFVDQTLERKIRELKVIGGITGITQDEEALNRLFVIAPELSRTVNSFQEIYGIDSNPTGEKQHYRLSTSMSLRIHENAAKITASIRDHCGGNPFAESTDLLNVVSSMVVPKEAKDEILLRDEKGGELFKTFVSERMVTDSAEKSIWDPVKKAKLKTFSSYQKKTKCKIGDKLVKLREGRQLLARFLVIQQSRPTLVSSLGDTIAKYEFSVIPRSLFSSDGLLQIPTDKSSFIHVIEHYPSENKVSTADQTVCSGKETVEGEPMSQCVVETYTDPSVTPCNDKVCIIDTMAVVQSIKDLDGCHSAAPVCRMILLGRTGSGKSSTGNTVLGRTVFHSEASPASVTQDCLLESGVREGKTVHVVDTPGIFDTTSNEVISRETTMCVNKSFPGPHAFILVTRISRFTQEDEQTFDTLENIFGMDMYKYAIVLFTGKDDIDSDKKTLEQYIEKAPPALDYILKKCEMRCLAFNNKGPTDARDAMCRDLLRMIDSLVEANHRTYYTNALYEEQEQAIKEKMKKTIDESLAKIKMLESDGDISRGEMATMNAKLLTISKDLKFVRLGKEEPNSILGILYASAKDAVPFVLSNVLVNAVTRAVLPAFPAVSVVLAKLMQMIKLVK